MLNQLRAVITIICKQLKLSCLHLMVMLACDWLEMIDKILSFSIISIISSQTRALDYWCAAIRISS